MDLHFDPDAHVYRIDGNVVPSVTQLLKPIGPDFSMVPPDVLEAKRALGTAVHLACEVDDEGDLDDDDLDPVLMPYVSAWRKFKADTGSVVLINEQKLGHRTLGYAGTLDRVVRVRNGDCYLVDLKTSVSMSASYGVQLAGYQLLLDDSDFNTSLARKGLQLKNDGTYKLVPFNNPNDAACFRALLSIYHWKENAK